MAYRQREAVLAAAAQVRQDVRRRVLLYATAAWAGLGSWRDLDVDRFVATVVPVAVAGRKVVATGTDVVLARLTGTRPAGTVDTDDLRGVGAEQVYRRPAVTMRTALAAGQTLSAAQAAALARLVSLVSTDLQLAHTHQAARTLAGYAPGFRRVLSGRSGCALCVLASTQRYRAGELMPIHPGCGCGVEPIDPARQDLQVLDSARLEALHQQVADFAGRADASGRDYRDLVVVHEHGEIGPVLGWRGQQFTGPHDLR